MRWKGVHCLMSLDGCPGIHQSIVWLDIYNSRSQHQINKTLPEGACFILRFEILFGSSRKLDYHEYFLPPKKDLTKANNQMITQNTVWNTIRLNETVHPGDWGDLHHIRLIPSRTGQQEWHFLCRYKRKSDQPSQELHAFLFSSLNTMDSRPTNWRRWPLLLTLLGTEKSVTSVRGSCYASWPQRSPRQLWTKMCPAPLGMVHKAVVEHILHTPCI